MVLLLAVVVRLRSGEVHGAQNLADRGAARPTAIKSWQMRSGEEERGGRRKKKEGGYNNPYLEAGKK